MRFSCNQSQGLIKALMSEKTAATPVLVSVRIDKWIEGHYGPYALAKVLSKDPPAAEAVFSVKKFKTEPVLGEPFDCYIAQEKGRWRVVAVAAEPEPVEKTLRGHVESSTGNGSKREWKIRISPESGVGHATLTKTVLGLARFAHIETGQEVVFIAQSLDGSTWTVTHLLAPKLRDVIDTTDPDQRYVVMAFQAWNSCDTTKSVKFAIHAPPSKIWPLLYVRPVLLNNQSIRALAEADLDDLCTIENAYEHLDDAAQTLQNGSTEELADLCVYCLQTTLKWDAQGYWNVGRLTAPLSLREPEAGEVIEWVQACINEVVQPKPKAENPSQPEGQEPSQEKTLSLKVWMDVNDPRLGRGKVSGFIKADMITAAGLSKGVQVVVRLGANKTFWNVKLLHRSTPMRENV